MVEQAEKARTRTPPSDRIEGNEIVLDGEGEFPKKLIIIEAGRKLEYRLIRTQNGRFLLN